MTKDKTDLTTSQEENTTNIPLEEILREGAQKLLQKAIETEIDVLIENLKTKVDENGNRLVVRNGSHKERNILTGLGPVTIKQPRVDDRKLREKYPEEKYK